MTLLTLSQAAKLAKKSKSTLHEAIHSGRLKASHNDKKQWQIDPDDLLKLYPQNERKTNKENESHFNIPNDNIAVLQQKIERLEQQLSEVNNERNELQNQLNEEQEERRNLTACLTKAIEGQDLPLSIMLDLTINQYNCFTILLKGINMLIINYPEFFTGLNGFYPESTKDFCKIGVVSNNNFSEKFKQVVDSILVGRKFGDITVYELLNIAKKYSE
jgi:hypothetical protein